MKKKFNKLTKIILKKILAVSSVLLGVVFLAGCGQKQPTPPIPLTQMPTQSVATQSASADETSDWKTYTNPTFGYLIKYPTTWTEKQANPLEAGTSEDSKNKFIEFYNDKTLMLRIVSDYKTKTGENLLSIASSGDGISEVVAYKIGNLDGYRRLLTNSDFGGLQYITKSGEQVYQMYTHENVESTEIINMLKTFTTEDKAITSEPLSYSMTGVSATVSKKMASFSYTAEQLKGMADECGSQHDAGYFDQLVSKFSGATKTTYNFKYTGASQGSDTFIVTLLPNKAGYTSLDQFKKDFNICYAGGEVYPKMLNNNWLLFTNSCGSGRDDGSGLPNGCSEVQKIVEANLKLN